MTTKSRRKLSSGLSGAMAGAGAGTTIGGPVGTVIGGLAGLAGGLLTPDEPQGMTEEEIQLQRDKMAQDESQFGRTLAQNQYESERTLGLAGLKELAAQREEARGLTKRRSFRNALLSSAQGVA